MGYDAHIPGIRGTLSVALKAEILNPIYYCDVCSILKAIVLYSEEEGHAPDCDDCCNASYGRPD